MSKSKISVNITVMKNGVLTKAFLLLALCVLLGLSAKEGWVTKAPMPTPRSGAVAVVVKDQIYVIGGYSVKNDHSQVLSVNERYDPQTDSWKALAPMSRPRSGAAAAVIDNKIYVIGGVDKDTNFTSLVERYDPETNAWKTVAPMSAPRGVPAAAVLDGKIYCVGGEAWEHGQRGMLKYLAVNEAYDPGSDKWSMKKPMPSPRPRPVIVAHGGKIYCIGGGQVNGYVLRTNERYDPRTDSWEILYPMPTGRSAAAAGIIDDKIYVFGGYSIRPLNFLSANEAYDIKLNRWSRKLSMPSARAGMVAAVIKGKVYLIGGYNDKSGFLGSNEQYPLS